jgi:uncharacterized protein
MGILQWFYGRVTLKTVQIVPQRDKNAGELYPMYDRLIGFDRNSQQSIFLLGPRGTGKTTWLNAYLPNALYFDLLDSGIYADFLANPGRLADLIPPGFNDWIVLDEIQKVPQLLNEVHRLIEQKKYKFVLTGSSARSLRRKGVNLLAGRALTYSMYPLTVLELGKDFNLQQTLRYGQLPMVKSVEDPEHYLESYVKTYLREEVLQEGLTRNIAAFTRFLEVASFSQGAQLNYSDIARDAAMSRKIVNHYFDIVEDLLIALRLPAFTKRAKREVVTSPKFYYFDVGVFRTLRPMGPLDTPEEAEGAALETLFLQELRAINDYFRLGYQLYYWRTRHGVEVDFIVYGEKGLHAFEIKRKSKISHKDSSGLRAFKKDYPMAKTYLVYGGKQTEYHGDVTVLPITEALVNLKTLLGAHAT